MAGEIVKVNTNDAKREHRQGKDSYEFYLRNLLAHNAAGKMKAAVYEIPPGKSNFPYHYHLKNEESFYILSGKGILKTPDGECEVTKGDFLFFPTGESGAHKLTNSSEDEMLVYLDIDAVEDLEVAFYPDSGKLGIWGKDVNRLFKTDQAVEYYEGE